jgi:hypothetical protein
MLKTITKNVKTNFSIFFKRIFIFSSSDKIILGRWGYHWEKKIKYQKYYD